MKKAVSGIVLTLLLLGMLTSALNVQPVKASGTIYIRADGSVEPDTAPISSSDNVTYTFTDNIVNNSIVVERSNIVVNGKGYILQGNGIGNGFRLYSVSNVTIKNISINGFEYGLYLHLARHTVISTNNITNNHYGIWIQESSNNTRIQGNVITNNDDNGIVLLYSSNNTVSANDITDNDHGMYVYDSSNNSISRNNIRNNRWDGIQLYSSSFNRIHTNVITTNKAGVRLLYSSNNNSISRNRVTNNEDGTRLWESSNNSIYENNITANYNYGIWLWDSPKNFIYNNDFLNNTNQVYVYESVNVWDDGSKGNYWSDYEERYPNATEVDGSGIWDTPYVINENNQDNYPIVPEFPTWTPMLLTLIVLTVAIVICKRRLLRTPIH